MEENKIKIINNRHYTGEKQKKEKTRLDYGRKLVRRLVKFMHILCKLYDKRLILRSHLHADIFPLSITVSPDN
jgi:hypothetical protein